MSATVTCELGACRSKLWILRFSFLVMGDRARARGASPQPRSAIVQEPVFRRGMVVGASLERVERVRRELMKMVTGLMGQAWVWCVKPAWYSVKRLGWEAKRVREVEDGVV